MKTAEIYLEDVKLQFKHYKRLGEQTFDQLSGSDLFWKLNDDHNSVAVIVKHLWGNMRSRWTDFLKSDGEKEWRNREREFVEDIRDKNELLSKWDEGWTCVFEALDQVREDQLNEIAYIRNMGQPVIQVINRQLAHYAYHIGQIVIIGKMIRGDDWKSLSIPRGESDQYNRTKFSEEKRIQHFTSQPHK